MREDHDGLLRANLQRVFNERDPVLRAAAIDELYVAEPVLYEPDAVVNGKEAIANVVAKLLEQLGPTFAFSPDGRAIGHHGLACLRWQGGSAAGPVVITGTDAAEIVDGKIVRLWVLLDAPPSR